MSNRVTIKLSLRSIIWAIALVIAVLLADHLANLLLMILVALIIAAALLPALRYFEEKRGLSRLWSTLAVFGVLILIVLILGLIVVPTLVEQAHTLATNLPLYTARVKQTYSWAQGLDTRHMLPNLSDLAAHLSKMASAWLGSSLTWAGKLLGGVLTSFVVVVLTFFLLLDGRELKRDLLRLVPPSHRPVLAAQFDPIALKLGAYVQGMMVSIGAFSLYLAIALEIVHEPLALALAILSGLLAIIPMVGGYLGLVPAVLIALTVSWQLAVVVLVVYYLGNTVLSHFLMPYVFAKSVEVSPLMVMLALLVGAELMGIAGALIAVPVMAAIQVLINNLYLEPMERLDALCVEPGIKTETPIPVRLALPE
ncbi:MAG TPA: AI-2E family transporter [Oscillatoriaceae cyanobacterium]